MMFRLLTAARLVVVLVFVCCAGSAMAETAGPNDRPPDPAARALSVRLKAVIAKHPRA